MYKQIDVRLGKMLGWGSQQTHTSITNNNQFHDQLKETHKRIKLNFNRNRKEPTNKREPIQTDHK